MFTRTVETPKSRLRVEPGPPSPAKPLVIPRALPQFSLSPKHPETVARSQILLNREDTVVT